MSRFRIHRIATDARYHYQEVLFRLMARLTSIGEVRDVLGDLLSLSESAMLVRRIEVAFLLLEGYTLREITKKIGCSRNLVRDVAASLGRNGRGYEVVSDRLSPVIKELDSEIKRWRNEENSESFDGMVRRNSRMFWYVNPLRDAPKAVKNISAALSRSRSLRQKKQ